MSTSELRVERDYAASAQAVFDAYFAMHADQRPAWMVDSQLDLRVGDTWTVTFHPPRLERFQEIRVFSIVDPPRHVAYAMTVVSGGTPNFKTTVDISISDQGDRSRLTLVQRGFPTTGLRDEFAGAWPAVLENVQQYLD
jgi:uncharacterized protein YndB with AHSA1/START domain